MAGQNVSRNPFDDSALAARYEAWYETEGRAVDRMERGLLGWLLGGFPGARSAVEIGARTRHFARWLQARGWNVIGLDVSVPMLIEAASRGGPGFLRAEAGALPFAAGAFDVVLLITTLEFLREPAGALREAAAFWCLIWLDILACDALAGSACVTWESAVLLGLTAASVVSAVSAWWRDGLGGLALRLWGGVFSLIAYLTSSRPQQAFSILVSGAPFLLAGLFLLAAGWGERRSATAAKVTP